MENLEKYLEDGSDRIGTRLSNSLNVIAQEAIRLKQLIDTAKTDLKKQYYRKKLKRVSFEGERIIRAISLLFNNEIESQNEGESI